MSDTRQGYPGAPGERFETTLDPHAPPEEAAARSVQGALEREVGGEERARRAGVLLEAAEALEELRRARTALAAERAPA